MLLFAAALAAATPSAATAPQAHCPRTTSQYAWRQGKPLKPKKLNALPPANAYVAVLRIDSNGCEAPIVVRYGVGGR